MKTSNQHTPRQSAQAAPDTHPCRTLPKLIKPWEDRKSEAGFTLVEAMAASVITLLTLLLVTGYIGAEGARGLLNQREEIGLDWATSEMGSIAARARIPTTSTRTEPALWPAASLDGADSTGSGSVLNTNPRGMPATGTAAQQYISGEGYIEFTPPNNSSITLTGPTSTRSIRIATGTQMSIYENGTLAAQTTGGAIPAHADGDAYRIELGPRTRYWRIRNGSQTLLWESGNSVQTGYPASASFTMEDENSSITNISMSGNLSNTMALLDGGTTNPVDMCLSPYCDLVWRSPREGTSEPAPVMLPPETSPADGSALLFVRRFRVSTIDAERGLREITMTLSFNVTSQPFMTRTTRVAMAQN